LLKLSRLVLFIADIKSPSAEGERVRPIIMHENVLLLKIKINITLQNIDLSFVLPTQMSYARLYIPKLEEIFV